MFPQPDNILRAAADRSLAANNALPDIDGGGTQIFVGSNSGDNNIVNVDPEFISYPTGGASWWNKGYDFEVQGGSVAENAGTDGTDIGLYGGLEPYDRTVSLPFIKQLITPSAVKQGTDLSVTIQAEAN